MYRSPPVVSPVLDIKLKQLSYKRHVNTLETMKPSLDHSHPPECPRLTIYRQRLTRERQLQMQVDNDNLRRIKEIERTRSERSRKSYNANPVTRTNWIRELQLQDGKQDKMITSQAPMFKPRPQTTMQPIRSQPTHKHVIHDDGMTVVDEQPIHPKVTTTSRSQSNKAPLEPLKPEVSSSSSSDDEHNQNESFESSNSNNVSASKTSSSSSSSDDESPQGDNKQLSSNGHKSSSSSDEERNDGFEQEDNTPSDNGKLEQIAGTLIDQLTDENPESNNPEEKPAERSLEQVANELVEEHNDFEQEETPDSKEDNGDDFEQEVPPPKEEEISPQAKEEENNDFEAEEKSVPNDVFEQKQESNEDFEQEEEKTKESNNNFVQEESNDFEQEEEKSVPNDVFEQKQETSAEMNNDFEAPVVHEESNDFEQEEQKSVPNDDFEQNQESNDFQQEEEEKSALNDDFEQNNDFEAPNAPEGNNDFEQEDISSPKEEENKEGGQLDALTNQLGLLLPDEQPVERSVPNEENSQIEQAASALIGEPNADADPFEQEEVGPVEERAVELNEQNSVTQKEEADPFEEPEQKEEAPQKQSPIADLASTLMDDTAQEESTKAEENQEEPAKAKENQEESTKAEENLEESTKAEENPIKEAADTLLGDVAPQEEEKKDEGNSLMNAVAALTGEDEEDDPFGGVGFD